MTQAKLIKLSIDVFKADFETLIKSQAVQKILAFEKETGFRVQSILIDAVKETYVSGEEITIGFDFDYKINVQ